MKSKYMVCIFLFTAKCQAPGNFECIDKQLWSVKGLRQCLNTITLKNGSSRLIYKNQNIKS